MGTRRASLAAALLAAIAAVPASAQTFETDLDIKKCRHTPGKDGEDYGSWRCHGYAGIPVWVTAGDQRMQMSFGAEAADQPAAAQTFPNFNNVYKARIEWRLSREGKEKPVPFATVVRWNVKIDDDNKLSRGRVLVVTRLGTPTCHVGYVDAIANKDANALARELADRHARDFDCAKTPRIIRGQKGGSIAGMAEELEREAEKRKQTQR